MSMGQEFYTEIELGGKLADLVRDLADWSRKTFGDDAERGPLGPLRHLEKEAKEAQQAVGQESFREELADCLLLLLDASRRGGVKVMQLVESAQAKLAANKLRSWPGPKTLADQPAEHVKESSGAA